MKKDRKDWVVRKVSFEEAEELDIAHYASVDWKESVRTVEAIRKQIWSEAYPGEMEKIIRKVSLKELTDDFE